MATTRTLVTEGTKDTLGTIIRTKDTLGTIIRTKITIRTITMRTIASIGTTTLLKLTLF